MPSDNSDRFRFNAHIGAHAEILYTYAPMLFASTVIAATADFHSDAAIKKSGRDSSHPLNFLHCSYFNESM